MLHRVYLSPGMFGFGTLGSYNYFVHVERALHELIRKAGDEAETHVVRVSPTASIRRRAASLVHVVARTCNSAGSPRGPIHLLGHSTGGLDARLAASPGVSLDVDARTVEWLPRLASVTMMNSPHFGTPLASFFTTAQGERVLRALSVLTVVVLSAGRAPLSALGLLLTVLGDLDRAMGARRGMLERATEALVRTLGAVYGREVREFVGAIGEDEGGVVQLTPEAMDLFAAAVRDRPGVFYQSTASMVPPQGLRRLLPAIVRPYRTLSGALFATLHEITARGDSRYPCAARSEEDSERTLLRAFGSSPGACANDGFVPTRSQLWGKLVWAGLGDHYDVIGHFRVGRPLGAKRRDHGTPAHVDWLYSGSAFDPTRFASLMNAIAAGIVSSGRSLAAGAPPMPAR